MDQVINFFKGVLDWIANNQNYILTIIFACTSITSAILFALAKITGNKKAIKVAQEFKSFQEAVEEFTTEAEQHRNFTGEDKKAYVVAKLLNYCIINKLNYSEEQISQSIDNSVAYTKQVNRK